MNRTCVIIADGGRARFFAVEEHDSRDKRPKLVEQGMLVNPDTERRKEDLTGRVRTETNTNRQAGPMHPIVAQRARHELELDRRFAKQIERRVVELTREWHQGSVILVAEPQLLGLLRKTLRAALGPGVELKELAKDYTHLTVGELGDHLALDRLIPAKQVSSD